MPLYHGRTMEGRGAGPHVKCQAISKGPRTSGAPHLLAAQKQTNKQTKNKKKKHTKNKNTLETVKTLSGEEHWLLLQRSQVQFSASMSGNSTPRGSETHFWAAQAKPPIPIETNSKLKTNKQTNKTFSIP